MTPGKSLSGKRILNTYTTAAAAQAESLRVLAAEARRYARDSALLALQELRSQAKAQGTHLPDVEIATAMRAIFGEEIPEGRVASLIAQARRRQESRASHVDPFRAVDQTLKQLRGIANAQETQD